MEYLYDVKKMLCRELEQIARQQELSTGDLDVIDKLTHSIKSIVTIMAMEDNGYSYNNKYSGIYKYNIGRHTDEINQNKYYDNNEYSGRRYYDDGYYGKRYSRDESKSHMIHQFENLMDSASSQEERDIIQSALNKLKNM